MRAQGTVKHNRLRVIHHDAKHLISFLARGIDAVEARPEATLGRRDARGVEGPLRDRVVAAEDALAGAAEVEFEDVADGGGEVVGAEFEGVGGAEVLAREDFDGGGGAEGSEEGEEYWNGPER